MAATRLIALHKNKGMTVAACLKNRTDYIENPDKTEQGQFVSSYACSHVPWAHCLSGTKRTALVGRMASEYPCSRAADANISS